MALFLLVAVAGATPVHARGREVKLATMAPRNSIWNNVLKEMKSDWTQTTGGDVTLKIYPDGTAGDEPNVVGDMKLGVWDAALLTTSGLIEFDESFSALALPVYESYEELYHVMQKMEPYLEAKLEAKGFVLLHWAVGGWIYFFSREPVRSIEVLQRQKIHVWPGDPESDRFWTENGFTTVCFSRSDLHTQLKSGGIDLIYNTPLAVLSFQLSRLAPNRLDFRIQPLVGATVISKEVWDKISSERKIKIREACRKAETRFFRDIPKGDDEAMREMESHGGACVTLDEKERAKIQAMMERFADYMKKNQVPAEAYRIALEHRDEYRSMRMKEKEKREKEPQAGSP